MLDANPLYTNQTYRLKFKFSSSYPIGMPPFSAALLPGERLTYNDRTPRSHLCVCPRPAHPHAPAHLLQRYHLPGSPGAAGLVASTKRGERLHESTKHADGETSRTSGQREMSTSLPIIGDGHVTSTSTTMTIQFDSPHRRRWKSDLLRNWSSGRSVIPDFTSSGLSRFVR